MVLLYRPSNNKVIWKGTGKFFHQHDVNILNKNKISVFNNNSKDFINGDIVDGNNEVLIYDFERDRYSSYLKESLIKEDIRTILAGRSTILDNGDLFVEETYYGRLAYFKADGSLRWSFVNKDSSGNVQRLGWSRILFESNDLKNVEKLLKLRNKCS